MTDADDEFWRDRRQREDSGLNVKDLLEARARSGKPMQNFDLSRADLRDVNLVNMGHHDGYDLSGSDFYRANLEGAHLFHANLRGASLKKANLSGANLHCVDLRDADMLGARFDHARLDSVNWGDTIIQERQAMEFQKQGDKEQARDFMEQSEEIYRSLRLSLEKAGLFEAAGHFFYREMLMRRLQMPIGSPERLLSKLVDSFCGYGEKPLRVILFSWVVMFSCSLLYFVAGIRYGEEVIAYSSTQDLATNVLEFLTAFYFSVVTFTTLGYGDLTPAGPIRALAAIEAFAGSFTIALFVVVFVKKMTR